MQPSDNLPPHIAAELRRIGVIEPAPEHQRPDPVDVWKPKHSGDAPPF